MLAAQFLAYGEAYRPYRCPISTGDTKGVQAPAAETEIFIDHDTYPLKSKLLFLSLFFFPLLQE